MRFYLLTSLVGLAISVRTVSRTEGWETRFHDYMAELETTANPQGINPGGRGKLFKSNRQPSKGLVLMQHGFTATPTFWYLIWDRLVTKGWDVMLPVFPGHGRTPTVTPNGPTFTYSDWLDELPTQGSQFSSFGDNMLEIAREYKAQKPNAQMVLAGVSHGGAFAAYVAMKAGAGFWDRILLLNPFFAPPIGLAEYIDLDFIKEIVPILFDAIGLFKDRFGWGEECEMLWWPNNTDGFWSHTGSTCQYSPENLRSVFEFALNVEGEMRSRSSRTGIFSGGDFDVSEGIDEAWSNEEWTLGKNTVRQDTKVQLIATENDGAVSNNRIHHAATAFRNGLKGNNFGYCAYPPEMGHTYINAIDKLSSDYMWWLDRNQVKGGKTIDDRIVEFLDKGSLFPTEGMTTEDNALLLDAACQIERK